MQTIQQTVQSHESAVKSVFEKGEALLDIVHDATISDNMKKMQADYQDLCLAAKVRALLCCFSTEVLYGEEVFFVLNCLISSPIQSENTLIIFFTDEASILTRTQRSSKSRSVVVC